MLLIKAAPGQSAVAKSATQIDEANQPRSKTGFVVGLADFQCGQLSERRMRGQLAIGRQLSWGMARRRYARLADFRNNPQMCHMEKIPWVSKGSPDIRGGRQ